MLAGTQFAHIGFTTKLPWYLRLGSTTHLLERWRAADVLDLAERMRLPTLGGVAAQIGLLLRDPGFDERDLSAVRQLVVGGGPSRRAGRRGPTALRRRLLDPLLVDRVGRRRHRHRVRRRRRRGAAHRRPAARRDRGGDPRRGRASRPDGEVGQVHLRSGAGDDRATGATPRRTAAGAARRRLAAHRRPRRDRRGRLPGAGRPHRRDVHPRWLQRAPDGGRGGARPAPGGGPGRGRRPARRRDGRGRGGRRRAGRSGGAARPRRPAGVRGRAAGRVQAARRRGGGDELPAHRDAEDRPQALPLARPCRGHARRSGQKPGTSPGRVSR